MISTKEIKVRLYSVTLSLLLMGICLGSCQTKTDNNTLDVLTLKGPSAMSMLFMMDEMTDIDNTPVSFEILDEPLQIRSRMLKGEPEMALLPTNMAANLYNKDVPYQICAISVWGTLVVFGKDKDIESWEDLKGKRVYLMARGMTPDILFRFLAERNGLDPEEDMILDYSFPTHTDLANAAIAGLADIAVLSEPLVSMVIQKNQDIEPLFYLDNEWKKVFNSRLSIPQTSLVVREDFASENSELVDAFIEKYQAFCSMLESDLERAGKLAVEFNILPDPSIAERSIPGCNMDVQAISGVMDRVNSFLEVFYTFNPETIGGKMPDENFFFKK